MIHSRDEEEATANLLQRKGAPNLSVCSPHRNQNPKPFTWTAKAKPILASHRRAKKAMAIVKAGCK